MQTGSRHAIAPALLLLGVVLAAAALTWRAAATPDTATPEDTFANRYVTPIVHHQKGKREIPDMWRELDRDFTLQGTSLNFLPGKRPSTRVDERVLVRRSRDGKRDRDDLDLVATHGPVVVHGADQADAHRLLPDVAHHRKHWDVRNAVHLGHAEDPRVSLLADQTAGHMWSAQKVVVQSPSRPSATSTAKPITLDASQAVPQLCIGSTCLTTSEIVQLNQLLKKKPFTWSSLYADNVTTPRGTVDRDTQASSSTSTQTVHLGNVGKTAAASSFVIDAQENDSLHLRPSTCSNGVRFHGDMKTHWRFHPQGLCVNGNHGKQHVPNVRNISLDNVYTHIPKVPYTYTYRCGPFWNRRTCEETKYATASAYMASQPHPRFSTRTSTLSMQ